MAHQWPDSLQIPQGEINWGGFWLKATSIVLSDKSRLQNFQAEAAELLRIYDEDESYDVFADYRIPRIAGLLPTTCQWSIAMILEHLCLVHADLIQILETLCQGIEPRGEYDFDIYQPDADVGTDVRASFVGLNERYIATVEQLVDHFGSLKTIARFRHPWYGPLTASQWHSFAGIHLKIHRRQAQKIIAMMGVA